MSSVNLNLTNDVLTANFFIEGTTGSGGPAGNISAINLDGNVSNVLRGDGTWGIGGGGGTANVAGTNGQIQYNNGGDLGAITGFSTNGANITGSVSNLKLTGGSSGQFLTTDGTGNLSFDTVPGYIQTPRLELTSPASSTTNPSWTHSSFAYFNDDGSKLNIFKSGVLTDKDKWTLSGTTLTWNGTVAGNTQFDVIPQFIAVTGTSAPAGTVNATDITFSGTATGGSFVGDGSGLTGIPAGSRIANTTTSVSTLATGHVKVVVDGSTMMNIDTNNIEAYSNILPAANIVYDLGSPTRRWRDLYLSNNTIYLNDVSLSATANGLSVDGSVMATESFVTDKITEIVGSAPAALDTLSEIGNALANDPNFAGTITSVLATKVSDTDFTNYQTQVSDIIANVVTMPYFTVATLDISNSIANLTTVSDFTYYQNTTANTIANLASKQFVTDEIANISIPNISGLASETFVTNAISNIPPTDLSAYATNTSVDNKIANITFPTYGNVANLNLDGNVGNLLRGDGTWGAIPLGGSSNYANFAGQANTANTATVANSVALANVVGIGNIANLNINGNASTVLLGNGAFSNSLPAVGSNTQLLMNNGGVIGNTSITWGNSLMSVSGGRIAVALNNQISYTGTGYSNDTLGPRTVYAKARGTRGTGNLQATQVGDDIGAIYTQAYVGTGLGNVTNDGQSGWTQSIPAVVGNITALPTALGGYPSTSVRITAANATTNAITTVASFSSGGTNINGSLTVTGTMNVSGGTTFDAKLVASNDGIPLASVRYDNGFESDVGGAISGSSQFLIARSRGTKASPSPAGIGDTCAGFNTSAFVGTSLGNVTIDGSSGWLPNTMIMSSRIAEYPTAIGGYASLDTILVTSDATSNSTRKVATFSHDKSTTLHGNLVLSQPFVPTSSTDSGQVGQMAWDDDYVYVYTSTGWKRSSLTSW